MEYIPSRYTHSEVLEIIEKEKNKTKNPLYVRLKLYRLVNLIGAFIFYSFLIYQYLEGHIIYLFPWRKLVEHYSRYGNVELGAFTVPLLYGCFCLLTALLIYIILSLPIKGVQKHYEKKGLIIPSKYDRWTCEEIKVVYEQIERFSDYIERNPELTEKDFQVDRTGRYLTRTIYHMDGNEKIEFYFGPYLKEIIIEHTVLDFSKLDKAYNLIDD